MTVCRIHTLQVCAVLASETATLYDEPFVERLMLQRLHPMLLNKQWVMLADEDPTGEKNVVAEHVEFLAKHDDPETGVPYLRR